MAIRFPRFDGEDNGNEVSAADVAAVAADDYLVEEPEYVPSASDYDDAEDEQVEEALPEGGDFDFDNDSLEALDDDSVQVVASGVEIAREVDVSDAAAARHQEQARAAVQYPFEWSDLLAGWDRFKAEATGGAAMPRAQQRIADAATAVLTQHVSPDWKG